jgi:S1-C subfamily serine protease
VKRAPRADADGDARRVRRPGLRGAAAALSVLLLAAGSGCAAPVGEAPPATAPAPKPARSVSPQGRAAEFVAPATVFMQVDWTANVSVPDLGIGPARFTWESVCSGFVVDQDGLLLTAGHCLDPTWEGARRDVVANIVDDWVAKGIFPAARRDEAIDVIASGKVRWRVEGNTADSPPERRVQVTIGGGKAAYRPPDTSSSTTPTPHTYEATVLEVRPFSQGDVGLLKIDARNLPIAVLSDQFEVKAGDQVVASGYPFELVAPGDDRAIGLTHRGGSVDTTDTTGLLGPGPRFYSISSEVFTGMSGCPAENLDGNVIGMVSSRVGSGTAFIVPSSVIKDFFGGRFQNTPGHIDELYRQGLENYDLGYYSDAISNFDQVLAVVPDLPAVVDKKLDAAHQREQFGDQPKPVVAEPAPPWWRSPLLAYGAAGLAVLLLGVWAGVRFLRARARRHGAGSLWSSLTMPIPRARWSSESRLRGPVPGPVRFGSSLGTTGPRGSAMGPGAAPSSPMADTRGGRRPDQGGPVVARPVPLFCPSCRAQAGPRDVFCAHCGTALGPPAR